MDKISKEIFIEKAKLRHGKKYNYDLVEYKNNYTKIKIICLEHGVFEQAPDNHLRSNGCLRCSGNNKHDIESFIKKAKQVHNDKFDYSKVEYINNKTKVCIICPEHGEFWQVAGNHISIGQGCPNCNFDKRRLVQEKFLNRANLKHNNKYDYSLVKYINSNTKIKIICLKHGEFEQAPNKHMSGRGCPKCQKTYSPTTEEFIENAKKVHGDKFDYSKVEYSLNNIDVTIICPIHGEFEQLPNSHLMGHGCIKCQYESISLDLEQFIERASKIHDFKYNYSLVKFTNTYSKIKIMCPKHGEFEQRAGSHLFGIGCPQCSESKGEKRIRQYLNLNNIKFKSPHRFSDCKNKNELPFDFYLFEHKICIEFDGSQHYRPVKHWGGEESFKGVQKRDAIKNQYCLDKNIKLIRIPYWKLNYIEKILNKELNL